MRGCWDLAEIDGRYDSFVQRYQPALRRLRQRQARDRLLPPDECFVWRFWATYDYSEFPQIDPLLPDELLPRRWRGHQAYAVLTELRRLTDGPAWEYLKSSGLLAPARGRSSPGGVGRRYRSLTPPRTCQGVWRWPLSRSWLPSSPDPSRWIGILSALRDLVEDPDVSHRAALARTGGRVVGHFQVYFPEEIAHAAGHAAVQGARRADRGDAGRGALRLLPLLDPQDLARAGPQRRGRARSVRHAPHLRRRPQPGRRSGDATFPIPARSSTCRRTPTPRYAAGYLRDEYERLRRTIEAVAGRADHRRRPAPLDRASSTRTGALLRALYAIKRETPWLLAVGRSLRPDGAWAG